jgi:N-methylhydantoinase A
VRDSRIRLAVDIGGTFTDVVVETAHARHTKKVLTTPAAPEEGVMSGVLGVLAEAGLTVGAGDVIIHGTTLATNAIIERKGARTALIATEGFRDTLDIADEGRYDQYDIDIDKPRPLVPRAWRFTVPERIDVEGQVRRPLDEAAVTALVPRLEAAGIESVAVALMHSYANPAHERRIGTLLRQAMPGLWLTLSSECCPEIREYERTSTACANAYVQPLMAGYIKRLEARLDEVRFRGALYLMTSGGGLASADVARRFPVRLIESGPAGGAILAAEVAAQCGEPKVLSYDMGGTTAKICLIEDFRPHASRSFEVDRAARFLKGSGLPLRIPVIEMVEIGAGGGSIARVDGLGRITVGPDSAGAEPGPACYDRGGTEPTVTDADTVLGRIDPKRFAGGRLPLDTERARRALDRTVGQPLGLDTELAAFGVDEIVDETMANAARVHAIERGKVIGDCTLIAFGGAAPLHAARLAEKLGIARVIVPPDAGVGSAIGFLRAPIAYERVQSRYMRLEAFDAEAATRLLTELAAEAHDVVAAGAAGQTTTEARAAYMRYVGQGHEIPISLPSRPLAPGDGDLLRREFERVYAAMFARYIPAAAIEILTWTVTVSTPRVLPAPLGPPPAVRVAVPSGRRPVFDPEQGRAVDVPMYWRPELLPGDRLDGPAVIAEDETSTFLTDRYRATINAIGCIVLERTARAEREP